jgi:protocatechuate 3,4-dioxygenase beta subunit
MLAGAVSASAEEPRCFPTRATGTSNYPGAQSIPTSNNLLKPAGKSIPASGQQLILTGRILDTSCAPIPEAVVELWQVSPFGRWLLPGAADLATPNTTWAGAGRTYTDIDGRFNFITGFPAPVGKRAPMVFVRVKSKGVPVYTSALFFADDTRNDKDVLYKRISGQGRNDITIRMREGDGDVLIGSIDIVMAGKTPYRTY